MKPITEAVMVGTETTLSAPHSSRSSCISACRPVGLQSLWQAGDVNNGENVSRSDAIAAPCVATGRPQHSPRSRAVLFPHAAYANITPTKGRIPSTAGLCEPENSDSNHRLPDGDTPTLLHSQFDSIHETLDPLIEQTSATSRLCTHYLFDDEPFYTPPRQRFSPSTEPSELSYASCLEDQPQTSPRPASLPDWLPVVQSQPVSKFHPFLILATCTVECLITQHKTIFNCETRTQHK